MTMIGGYENPGTGEVILVWDSFVTDASDSKALDPNCKFHLEQDVAILCAGAVGPAYRAYAKLGELRPLLDSCGSEMERRLALIDFFKDIEDFEGNTEAIVAYASSVYAITTDMSVFRTPGVLVWAGSGGPFLAGAYSLRAAKPMDGKTLSRLAAAACAMSASSSPPICVWSNQHGFL